LAQLLAGTFRCINSPRDADHDNGHEIDQQVATHVQNPPLILRILMMELDNRLNLAAQILIYDSISSITLSTRTTLSVRPKYIEHVTEELCCPHLSLTHAFQMNMQ
jgi:hypothetical protein